MTEKNRIVVVGARGVFGTHLVDALGDRYDLATPARGAHDFRGAFAVACTAGPFQQLDRALVREAVDAGAHWLDIADDARWFFDLVDDRALDARAGERGVLVMPGLSTLPALSCALAKRVMPTKHVDITLFIGNDNRKGAAAIASGATLETPDRELLRRELGIDATVATRFELPGVRAIMRVLAMLPLRARLRVARALSRLPLRFGTSGGSVEARTRDRVERVRGEQNIAILPLIFALEQIDALPRGVHPPTILDAEALLDFVAR
ncbi:MAG TPA: hypothetical protein VJZ00_02035 [Thermoanaerobaculia bacterium]|nr:hypothetical protein [Thermoanaerobaculia bacterium]